MKTFKDFINEDMAAGDAGGNPTNIATGTTSGAVVNKGPEQIPSKKRKNKDDKPTV
ncbi:major capsid domain-containing protein [Escherichia phage UPEC07]|nr:major capsid domain-containing protein [Escherichia phage UPEC07]